MNKAAAKEPSMDEILSSIRQIIADDDTGAPVPEMAAAKPAPQDETDDIGDINFDLPGDGMDAMEADNSAEDEGEPLALSAEQIVADDEADGDAGFALAEPAASEDEDDSEDFKVPDLVVPDDDITFDEEKPAAKASAEPRPAPAAPVADMPGRLLDTAADAAVKSSFARLGALPVGSGALTIENMIREMLRPMLKEWLDENLPGMVQKMVEKEIERLSRGG